jgi:hypothetical protein
MKTGWVGLVALLFLGGCGVENIAGRPERSDHRKAIVKRIEDREDLRIEEMVSQYHEARTSDGEKLEIRNKIIDVGLLTMDQYYSLFVDGFSAGKKSIDTFAEIGAMATNAAGAALGSATTKSVLHIVSGGLIASQTSISKNYFYEQTIAALIKQMEAERRAVSVDIIRGTGLPISQYPLAAALADLERYYFAGTVDGALAGIQRDAARKDNESGTEIKNIRERLALTVDYLQLARAWIAINGVSDARTRLKTWAAAQGPVGTPPTASLALFELRAALLGELQNTSSTKTLLAALPEGDRAEAGAMLNSEDEGRFNAFSAKYVSKLDVNQIVDTLEADPLARVLAALSTHNILQIERKD